MRRPQAFQEWQRCRLIAVAGDRAEERNGLMRFEIELERSKRRRQMCRRRLESDARLPHLAVETQIGEIRSIALDVGTDGTTPPAPGPPDLEHVGEIVVESDRQKKPDSVSTEISHGKAMKQGGSPNEDRPRHVQQVFLKDDAVVVVDVGIGEI